MPKRLTLAEQRRLVTSIPPSRRSALRKHCAACQMKGKGVSDILKTIGSVLGPIAKELGPVVMKELVLPFIKKRIESSRKGNGLKLSGQGLGLAGGRGIHKRRK